MGTGKSRNNEEFEGIDMVRYAVLLVDCSDKSVNSVKFTPTPARF